MKFVCKVFSHCPLDNANGCQQHPTAAPAVGAGNCDGDRRECNIQDLLPQWCVLCPELFVFGASVTRSLRGKREVERVEGGERERRERERERQGECTCV